MIKKIYFGGRFSFQYKDYTKEKLAMDYRSIILGDVNKILHSPNTNEKLTKISENVFYTGPYYFYEEGTTAKDIVKNEIEMVERCTDAIFLLDNESCPGTITEIIHSVFKNKIIHIFYVKIPIDNGEPENEINSKQWYPIMFSLLNNDKVFLTECKTRDDATKKIISFINKIK